MAEEETSDKPRSTVNLVIASVICRKYGKCEERVIPYLLVFCWRSNIRHDPGVRCWADKLVLPREFLREKVILHPQQNGS